ncbi:hypothetical protein ADIS_3376 [Lunatimonas lonarensis]|uniref:Uncharacterized protein n=1 Tax=Lunatimonas lonarensis TaxID=1232681 RepID=R7ZQB8_9BACT|nr:hypothetical protein ADIS_3376 [Lunatimonas lonarensis]
MSRNAFNQRGFSGAITSGDGGFLARGKQKREVFENPFVLKPLSSFLKANFQHVIECNLSSHPVLKSG